MQSKLWRAFRPTEEQKAADIALYEKLTQRMRESWMELGLSEQEADFMSDLEAKETAQLRSFETYVSRRDLLKGGLITIADIKKDLERAE